MEKCPICARPFGDKKLIEFHHLIPRTFRGKEGIYVHKVCHQKIHATFAERELQHHYHTVERLVRHEEMMKFITWVRKKHVDFYDKNDDTGHRHKKRKR